MVKSSSQGVLKTPDGLVSRNGHRNYVVSSSHFATPIFNTFTFHVINKLAKGPGLYYSLEHGSGMTPESEAIWVKFVKNDPQAKPFKTKGWPHYATVKNLIPSKLKIHNKNVSHDVRHPTSPSSDKRYRESMTEALSHVSHPFALCSDTSLILPISSSESESGDADGIYAPRSVSASQYASFLQAFEQLGESLNKLVSTFGNIPEMSPQCSVDLAPICKQRVIVQVQKEDLEDREMRVSRSYI